LPQIARMTRKECRIVDDQFSLFLGYKNVFAALTCMKYIRVISAVPV